MSGASKRNQARDGRQSLNKPTEDPAKEIEQ
jgi:hypothetical protein